jgi:hypothetical protein
MRISSVVSLLAAIVILASALTASQISIGQSNVIGGSGSYSGSWNDPTFGAQNVLSQQTGSIHESFGNGYWINPDNGPPDAYIVLDLGAQYQITSFELYNTHNGGYNDRGTGDFQIRAGNSLGVVTSNGFDLNGVLITITSGTLFADTDSNTNLTPQDFTVSNNGTYRYLRFEPLGVASSGAPCCGANVYGLNEIRVFGDIAGVPEPATWLTAVPLLALLWKRLSGNFC